MVLSKLPIGDLATQFFADRDIFCAGGPRRGCQSHLKPPGLLTSTVGKFDRRGWRVTESRQFEERRRRERLNFFNNGGHCTYRTLILRVVGPIVEIERPCMTPCRRRALWQKSQCRCAVEPAP